MPERFRRFKLEQDGQEYFYDIPLSGVDKFLSDAGSNKFAVTPVQRFQVESINPVTSSKETFHYDIPENDVERWRDEAMKVEGASVDLAPPPDGFRHDNWLDEMVDAFKSATKKMLRGDGDSGTPAIQAQTGGFPTSTPERDNYFLGLAGLKPVELTQPHAPDTAKSVVSVIKEFAADMAQNLNPPVLLDKGLRKLEDFASQTRSFQSDTMRGASPDDVKKSVAWARNLSPYAKWDYYMQNNTTAGRLFRQVANAIHKGKGSDLTAEEMSAIANQYGELMADNDTVNFVTRDLGRLSVDVPTIVATATLTKQPLPAVFAGLEVLNQQADMGIGAREEYDPVSLAQSLLAGGIFSSKVGTTGKEAAAGGAVKRVAERAAPSIAKAEAVELAQPIFGQEISPESAALNAATFLLLDSKGLIRAGRAGIVEQRLADKGVDINVAIDAANEAAYNDNTWPSAKLFGALKHYEDMGLSTEFAKKLTLSPSGRLIGMRAAAEDELVQQIIKRGVPDEEAAALAATMVKDRSTPTVIRAITTNIDQLDNIVSQWKQSRASAGKPTTGTTSGSPSPEPPPPVAPALVSDLTSKPEVISDQENVARVPSGQPQGQVPVAEEPVQGAGGQAPAPSGMVQAPPSVPEVVAQPSPAPAPAVSATPAPSVTEDAARVPDNVTETPPAPIVPPVPAPQITGETPAERLISAQKLPRMTKDEAFFQKLVNIGKTGVPRPLTPFYPTGPDRQELRQQTKGVKALQSIIYDADPTPQHKYRDWLLNQFKQGLVLQEDVGNIRTRLESFDIAKRKAIWKDKKDINQYASFSELAETLDKYPEFAVGSAKIQDLTKLPPGAEVTAKEDDPNGFTVVKITDTKAAKKLCAESDWCVTNEDVAESYLHEQVINAPGELDTQDAIGFLEDAKNDPNFAKLSKRDQGVINSFVEDEELMDSFDIYDYGQSEFADEINPILYKLAEFMGEEPKVQPLFLVYKAGRPFALAHPASGQFKDVHDATMSLGKLGIESPVGQAVKKYYVATSDATDINRHPVPDLTQGTELRKFFDEAVNAINEESRLTSQEREDLINEMKTRPERAFLTVKQWHGTLDESEAVRIHDLVVKSGVTREQMDPDGHGFELAVLHKASVNAKLAQKHVELKAKFAGPDIAQLLKDVEAGFKPSLRAIEAKYKIGHRKAKELMDAYTAHGGKRAEAVQAPKVAPDLTTTTESAVRESAPDTAEEPTASDLELPPQVDPALEKSLVDFSKPASGELPENWLAKGWKVERLPNHMVQATSPKGKQYFVKGTALFEPRGPTPEPELPGAPKKPKAAPAPRPRVFQSDFLESHAGDLMDWIPRAVVSMNSLNLAPADLAEFMLDRLSKEPQDESVKDELTSYIGKIIDQFESEGLSDSVEPEDYSFPGEWPSHLTDAGPVDPIFGNEVPKSAVLRFDLSQLPLIDVGKKPTSVVDVIKELERAIQIAGGVGMIRSGHVPGVAGKYKVQPDIIRLREANDIPVAAHETGHALLKAIFGSPAIRQLSGGLIPQPVMKDLVKLGKLLYGNVMPSGGYSSEGWGEFIRRFLTYDDAGQNEAPHTYGWFTTDFARSYPDVFKAIQAARDVVTRYRQQGAVARVSAFQVTPQPIRDRIKNMIHEAITKFRDNLITDSAPLERIVARAKEAGRILPIEDDPALSYEALQMTWYGVVDGWVYQGMTDAAGNIVGPSLDQIFSSIKSEAQLFQDYVVALRAQELNREGKQSGLSDADVKYVVDNVNQYHPNLVLAAANLRKFTNGMLDYARQFGLITQEDMDAITSKYDTYIPFFRVYETSEPGFMTDLFRHWRTSKWGNKPSPLKRMVGSGRRIYSPWYSLLEAAYRMVRKSHERFVLNQVLKLRHLPGMGEFIEEIPKGSVPTEISLDHIKKQLEDAGMDTTQADLDAKITFFTPQMSPHSMEPIVAVYENGDLKWFRVSPDLYSVFRNNEVARLPMLMDIFLGIPKRLFVVGTTALNAAFSWAKNPSRDIVTGFMQTDSSKSALWWVGNWFATLSDALNPKTHNKYHQLFKRLGGEISMPLGLDTPHTSRTIKGLFRGRVWRIVSNPIDFMRSIFQIPEGVTRSLEIKAMKDEIGWDGTSPITISQMLTMLLSSKRVSVNFSQAGKLVRQLNTAVPFLNPGVQGLRAGVRTTAKRPQRTILRGLLWLTLPTLLLWWKNKDKKWWKDMPTTEKFAYWHIQVGDEIIRYPRPFEWGAFFATLPEGLMDAAYREDPETVKKVFGAVFDQISPVGTWKDPNLPPPLKVAREQWRNKIDYSGAKIVPESEKDLPPGEQKGPYTSRLAEIMGETFPNTVSPRRFDHVIRGFFGGVGADILNLGGYGTIRANREPEPADIPVVGSFFRRGGEHPPQSVSIDKLFETYGKYQSQFTLNNVHMEPEPREDAVYRLLLTDAKDAITFLHHVQVQTKSRVARAMLQQRMVQIADEALASERYKDRSEIIRQRVRLKTGPLLGKDLEGREKERTIRQKAIPPL